MNQSGARSITHEEQAGFRFTRQLLRERIKAVCFFALIVFVFKPDVINAASCSTGTRLGANEKMPVRTYAMYDPQLEHHWIFEETKDTPDNDRYNHMVSIAFFDGKFHAVWNTNHAPSFTKNRRHHYHRRPLL